MTREELEHVIRSAGAIAGTKELIILGSQAILGTYPSAPAEILVSEEVDTYPADDPEKADLIDGCIGEKSPFHEEFGYYAHGVGPETATLPSGWKSRVVTVLNENTKSIAGLCLHPADLAVSKLAAGREKDMVFVGNLLRYELVSAKDIQQLLSELDEDQAKLVRSRLRQCCP